MTKKFPWTCNFCGGKLMFTAKYPFPQDWLKELQKYGFTGKEEIELQVCNNPKCQRKYFFFSVEGK